jgi:hypothetical protein
MTYMEEKKLFYLSPPHLLTYSISGIALLPFMCLACHCRSYFVAALRYAGQIFLQLNAMSNILFVLQKAVLLIQQLFFNFF